MTLHPSDQMRGYIPDIKTYGLAEQSGMFCEALRDCLSDPALFDGMQFDYSIDEPYEVVYLWDLDDIRAKLTFMGDPDNSTWSVTSRKKRSRGAIGQDRHQSCKLFLDAIRDILCFDDMAD